MNSYELTRGQGCEVEDKGGVQVGKISCPDLGIGCLVKELRL